MQIYQVKMHIILILELIDDAGMTYEKFERLFRQYWGRDPYNHLKRHAVLQRLKVIIHLRSIAPYLPV